MSTDLKIENKQNRQPGKGEIGTGQDLSSAGKKRKKRSIRNTAVFTAFRISRAKHKVVIISPERTFLIETILPETARGFLEHHFDDTGSGNR